MKISATIITFNEEQNIKRCLDTLLEVADEIIVVDSYSTDQTETICKQYEQVRFIKNEFKGHIEQKNFAIQQAKHEWILSLDADECLSEDLKTEIKIIKSADPDNSQAYSMPRLNNYCGQWIRHSGWYPDRKVRLWDREVGEWGGQNPHDKVILDNGVQAKRLNGDILHYTIPSLNAHIAQVNKFSDIAAQQLLESKKNHSATFKMILNPPFMFLKRYILNLGFLDGFYGLTIAVISAYAKFLKYAKYIHLKSQK
ncbi:MAG: glycosyltransferase family 2 protein [Bacteroidota bacterium]